MSIVLKVADAHINQLSNPEIKREYDSIQIGLDNNSLIFKDGTVNFIFVKGVYLHTERKMVTACVFVNKYGKPICELHGELRLKFKERNALIAKTTVNFDREFMGQLEQDQALLVHLNIPVKGLETDEVFTISDLSGSFDEIKITEA